MSLTASENFIKYTLFVFNFVFVITGIILISVGATVQGVFHGYSHFLSDQFFTVPSFLIAIGVIIFIIAFFGCCGAAKENYCMILTFAVLMVLVFILEMAAGISGYVLRNDAVELVRRGMQATIPEFLNQTGDITYMWDHVQQGFSCCGVDKYEDWFVKENTQLPLSCCTVPQGGMDNFVCNNQTKTLFTTGCVDSFGIYIQGHAVSLGAAGVAICIIQFIGIFFACYLARQIKNKTGHSGF